MTMTVVAGMTVTVDDDDSRGRDGVNVTVVSGMTVALMWQRCRGDGDS